MSALWQASVKSYACMARRSPEGLSLILVLPCRHSDTLDNVQARPRGAGASTAVQTQQPRRILPRGRRVSRAWSVWCPWALCCAAWTPGQRRKSPLTVLLGSSRPRCMKSLRVSAPHSSGPAFQHCSPCLLHNFLAAAHSLCSRSCCSKSCSLADVESCQGCLAVNVACCTACLQTDYAAESATFPAHMCVKLMSLVGQRHS